MSFLRKQESRILLVLWPPRYSGWVAPPSESASLGVEIDCILWIPCAFLFS
jgi:hypothetical protein